jgi:hypothetical protein
MPYRYAVKVSERVYRMLLELTRKQNLEPPNQLLERLLAQGVTLSAPDRVTLCLGELQPGNLASWVAREPPPTAPPPPFFLP